MQNKKCYFDDSGNFVMASVGNEISAVLFGVDSEIINNTDFLFKTLKEGLEKEKFGILGYKDHKFEPQGYTVTFILSESHLAVHTYPEFNSIAFQIYSCRGPEDGILTYNYFVEKLKPSKVVKKDFRVVVDPDYNK